MLRNLGLGILDGNGWPPGPDYKRGFKLGIKISGSHRHAVCVITVAA